MAGARSALIVAADGYDDDGLRRLRAPAADARALARVLADPAIGGFEVRTLLNEPAHQVSLAVEEFFADRMPDDLLLLHFSCHGVKDESGELYFAMANTLLRRLAATAVAAEFVSRRMNRSRSRRVVLLLDCCYAGAFERGMTARAGAGMGIESQFGGRGRAVITASSAMEYAFEGDDLADSSDGGPSVFTSALVDGLETGDADRDQDGLVALDELYDYIYDRVRSATPHQTPGKWTFGVQGELVIARRARPVAQPAPLPAEVQDAIDSPLATVRVAAVRELARVLGGTHAGRRLAARQALQMLTGDDSRMVAAAAAQALSADEGSGGEGGGGAGEGGAEPAPPAAVPAEPVPSVTGLAALEPGHELPAAPEPVAPEPAADAAPEPAVPGPPAPEPVAEHEPGPEPEPPAEPEMPAAESASAAEPEPEPEREPVPEPADERVPAPEPEPERAAEREPEPVPADETAAEPARAGRARGSRTLVAAGVLAVAASILLFATLFPDFASGFRLLDRGANTWQTALGSVIGVIAGVLLLARRDWRLYGAGVLLAAGAIAPAFTVQDIMVARQYTAGPALGMHVIALAAVFAATCLVGIGLARQGRVRLRRRPDGYLGWLVVAVGLAGAIALAAQVLSEQSIPGTTESFVSHDAFALAWSVVLALVVPAAAVLTLPRGFGFALACGWIGTATGLAAFYTEPGGSLFGYSVIVLIVLIVLTMTAARAGRPQALSR